MAALHQGSGQVQPPAQPPTTTVPTQGTGIKPENAVVGSPPQNEKLPTVPANQPDVRAEQPLTIEEAANLAEQNAFAVRTAASQVEATRQRINQARGALGPQVNSTGVYTRYPEAQTAQINPDSPPIVIQPIDTRQASVSFQLPIDISGNLNRNVRAAQANNRASRQTLQAQRNQARLNGRNAFIGVLRAAAAVRVQEQAVADATENLRIQTVRFNAGDIARVNVVRASAQLEQANSDLINAQNNLQTAKENFNNVLARPIETPVTLAEIPALPNVTADPQELVANAQRSRPEVLSLQETQTALANSRRALEAGQNPSLAVGINTSRNFDPGAFGQKTTTVGTVTLNVPLFDSGITRARVREARQFEEQNRILLQQTELAVSLQVRQAVTNLISARARLASAQQQVALSEENLRIARVRNQAGEGIFLEIIDAETQLTQARNQLVSARYDYLNAYAALQQAVGTDQINGAAPPPAPQEGTSSK